MTFKGTIFSYSAFNYGSIPLVNNDFSPPTKPLSSILWWCSGAVESKILFYSPVHAAQTTSITLLCCWD